jgi:hypothetical protein
MTAASEWIPAAILPNLSARKAVEGEVIALAPRFDPRVHAFCVAHPNFEVLLSRFTDAFHVHLDPVVLIVRDDMLGEARSGRALGEFS